MTKSITEMDSGNVSAQTLFSLMLAAMVGTDDLARMLTDVAYPDVDDEASEETAQAASTEE